MSAAALKKLELHYYRWMGLADLEEALDTVRKTVSDMSPVPVIVSMKVDTFLNPAATKVTIEMGHLHER